MRKKLINGWLNMPVVDTEVIFALNPRGPKHNFTINLLKTSKNLFVPDTALLEFEIVLRLLVELVKKLWMLFLALIEYLGNMVLEKLKL